MKLALLSVVVCLLLGIVIHTATACPYPVPPWNCPQLPSPPPATNVRQLRPGNIKAIMAMGDSITAGFAMIGFIPPEDLVEWRNYVFSIGGADGAFTLANILKKYNPNVQGAAYDWTWPLTPGAFLDAGVSHASVQNTPSQVLYLVEQLNTTYASQINYLEDWKLLTLFIGANNLCGACEYRTESFPAYFESHLRTTLQMIEQKLPRTFVNLVTIFNISGVFYAGQNNFYCRLVWDLIKHECYCVETGNKTHLDIMDLRAVQFNAISEKLAAEWAAKNNPNFTVVVQPGLSGIPIAKYGEAYLSDLDCFHPSLCGNQAFTYQIWNNMMTPVGKKSTAPDVNNLKIKCPGPNDFIQ
jgi:small subunit ribosomal protein S29e